MRFQTNKKTCLFYYTAENNVSKVIYLDVYTKL